MSCTILVVDDHKAINEIITLYLGLMGDYNILTANSGNEAINIFVEEANVDLVISDFNMPDGTGADLYNFVKTHSPEIPFIIQSAEPLEFIDDLKKFTEQENEFYIQKPFTYEQFETAVMKVLSKDSTEKKYVKIMIPTLRNHPKVGVDTYVKLADDKFVKLRHAEDEFDEQSLRVFDKRGIKFFYIKQADVQAFLSNCQKNLLDQLSSPDLSADEMSKIRFDTYENLMSAIQYLGVDENILKQADQFTKAITKSIPKKSELVGLINKMRSGESYLSRLSLLTGNIALAIAQKISWIEQHNYEKLLTASIFMDLYWLKDQGGQDDTSLSEITYFDSAELINYTPSIQELILVHAQRGAELFAELRADGEIFNLIGDHHERPNKRGFPKHVDCSQISSIAAVLIMAHEFSHRLIMCPKMSLSKFTNIKSNLIKEFCVGNYRPACQGFITTFK